MKRRPIRRVLGLAGVAGLVLGLGAASATLAITARHLLTTPQPLDSGLPGAGRIDRKHGGELYYTVAGPEDAPPLVLLHDFYPGASNYEYRGLFPRLTTTYRVYALDWLGWGMSERPAVAYTGEFYAATLRGFLRDVVGQPALVVAHGHAAGAAVRAASDAPELFRRLVLVAPTLTLDGDHAPTPGQTAARLAQRLWLGTIPYAFLTARFALRRQEARRAANGGGDVSHETLDHLYASSHQFGGAHALSALLSGELDLPIGNAFALLEPPVLVVVGERDAQRPSDAMQELTALNPDATLVVLPNAGESLVEDEPFQLAERLVRWEGREIASHPVAAALAQPAPHDDATLRDEDVADVADVDDAAERP